MKHNEEFNETPQQKSESMSNMDAEKWYNNKSKLISSILFWPVLVYGIYKTDLISRKVKQLLAGTTILLFFMIGKGKGDDSTYVRITNFETYMPGAGNVIYTVLPKSDPSQCFHILLIPGNPKYAKTLDNPKLAKDVYMVIYGLTAGTDNNFRQNRIARNLSVSEEYTDIYDAIDFGVKHKEYWISTESYYQIENGDVYQKNTGNKLIDYLDKNEKVVSPSTNKQ